MESTAAAWHAIHYAALQRDRNIGKSLAPIRQQIDAPPPHPQIRERVKKQHVKKRRAEWATPKRRRPLRLPD
ncbi:hypothetical protein JJB98_19855 [Bradyrhizobium diazoefficiens]|nr:hypothetical protein [Bradyrhizobium diazoefficiens]QQO22025.1 hypothetical protein JJB98_19855 [Bradyrhizobium diazoefficiens]